LTNTPTTLHTAIAQAHLGPGAAPLAADPVALARAVDAATLAIKQLPFWLASASPAPPTDLDLTTTVNGEGLLLTATLRAVTASPLGTAALAAVTAAAISLIDQADVAVAVEHAEITATTGDLTQFRQQVKAGRAVVIVLSDTVASGAKPDTAGKSVVSRLEGAGFACEYEVLPDEPDQLEARLRHWIADGPALVITVGGTGIGPRDLTVETVRPLLTAEIPGVMEAARAYGQARTPYAALSRGIAGLAGSTLVITFPGSRRGAEETLDALLTSLVHLVEVARIAHPHQGGYE